MLTQILPLKKTQKMRLKKTKQQQKMMKKSQYIMIKKNFTHAKNAAHFIPSLTYF